jgi:hypothetical protein
MLMSRREFGRGALGVAVLLGDGPHGNRPVQAALQGFCYRGTLRR